MLLFPGQQQDRNIEELKFSVTTDRDPMAVHTFNPSGPRGCAHL